jgi:dCMP deaminase
MKINWNDYFMNIAEEIKTRSPDIRKVGAVMVSMDDNRIISTGFNGFVKGFDENIDFNDRQFVHSYIIHAEMNCILYAQSKFEDSILYITMSPCQNCLKLIAAARIKKIYYKNEYKDINIVREICSKYSIELIKLN